MKKISKFAVSAALVFALCAVGESVQADAIRIQWPQPGGPGTDVFVTYSYSNLLDGSFLFLSPAELRAATEEALNLWAAYAPLHFIEQPDSAPPPADVSYPADGHAQIRIGYHPMSELAHAFYPGSDGLAGDVHVDSGIPWTLGTGHWNFLEMIAHELGHAVGLEHELTSLAVMNPFYPQQRFHGLGTAFLFPADVENIQAIYGVGRGSVRSLDPVPEPGTALLITTCLAALARIRRDTHRPLP